MSDEARGPSERDRQVQELIAAYIEASSRGEAPPREEWLRAHADLADDLRRFLDNHEWMRRLGESLHQEDDSAATTTGAASEPSSQTLGTVHYFGDYELLEEIARGGMGVVYKARQISLNRIVALKMILSGELASERDVQRFRAEAEAVANLDHPNIVPLYEVGKHDGQQYFSMKFVEGGSLIEAMPDLQRDTRRAAALLASTARAIHFAHQRGILHRDLKPANILLDREGTPLVTDFGLARRVDGESSASQSGAIVGTPAYMAPEQARAEKQLTTAADVYGLGAILYECLSGRPPFQTSIVMDTLMQVIDRDPEHPRALNPRANADLCVIALKCLHKGPARRFESAAALAEELERWLRGEPILARPTGAMERAWRWARRNPAVAGLSAAVVMVMVVRTVVATSFGLWANQEASEARRLAGEEKKQREYAEAAAHRADVGRHGFQLTAAWQAWQQNDVEAAEAYLEEAQTAFQQTWEYRHVRELCRRKAMSLKGHAFIVLSVAISADAKRIVSGSADATVKVWDAVTGQNLLSLKGHTSSVTSVRFSPDGKRIVSGSSDKTMQVWDARTGQHLRTLKGHTNGVLSVAISADGKRIVSGSDDRTLKVWDARTGQEMFTLKGHTNGVHSVAIGRDGKHIVSGSWDQTVKVWDVSTRRDLFTLKGHPTGVVTSVAISPDGKRIVSGSFDKTVKVWDTVTGQDLLSLKGHTTAVSSVAISPDGKRIVSGSFDSTVKVWDAGTHQDLLTCMGHTDSVTSVAISPDGKRIVSGSTDETLKVWDRGTGQDQFTLMGHAEGVNSVAFSSDGKRIVSGSDDRTLKVWDARTGQKMFTLKGLTDRVSSVGYSPDGNRIVSGSWDHMVKMWDARTGQEMFTLKGHPTGVVTSVTISPDGKRIVSSSFDRTVKVWDSGTGQELFTLKGHAESVHSVAISPDGNRIVSGSADNTVKVWDAATGQDLLTLKGHTNGVSSVAFSPDGNRIVSGSEDNSVKVWDAGTGPGLLADLTPEEQWRQQIQEERIKEFLDNRACRQYHATEAETAELNHQPFAAVFHLDRLLPLLPHQRRALLARRRAVLSTALKKTPGDRWAVRALAHQAIGDSDSLAERETLLSLRAGLATQQDAPHDRLYGALLLHTGSPKEAILVLRPAMRKRGPDGPPVEELLLALAHLQRKQPAAARQHLQTAVAWMRRGTEPVRAAAMAGLATAGPLSALSGLAVTPPDPRLESLDPTTAHELRALRGEVEKAMAK